MTRSLSPPASIDLPSCIRLARDHLTLEVAVRPGASRSAILRMEERGIVIGIAAPAERGKANDELIRFLAKLAGVPRAAVSIIRGETGRRKTLRIESASPVGCAAKLMETSSSRAN